MNAKQRNEIRELADKKHKGNLEAAACDWLGLGDEYKAAKGVPNGNVGAVHNIVDEVERFADADAEESHASAAAAGGNADGSGNDGKKADGGSGE